MSAQQIDLTDQIIVAAGRGIMRSRQHLSADRGSGWRGTNRDRGGDKMLARLIDEAMEHAIYEIIEGEGTYWGEIPEFQGVWARHTTLEGCRRELREALSDWIALRLRLGLPVPIVANLDLSQILQPV